MQEALIKAYPEQKMRYAGNSICFPDGTSIIYDDKKNKDFPKMLDDSDIEDMFSIPYDTIGKPKYRQMQAEVVVMPYSRKCMEHRQKPYVRIS